VVIDLKDSVLTQSRSNCELVASVERPSVDVLTRIDELVVQDQEIASCPVFEHFAITN